MKQSSAKAYFNTDTGHGVVYQGQPALNANNHVKEVNLTHFGDYGSMTIDAVNGKVKSQ